MFMASYIFDRFSIYNVCSRYSASKRTLCEAAAFMRPRFCFSLFMRCLELRSRRAILCYSIDWSSELGLQLLSQPEILFPAGSGAGGSNPLDNPEASRHLLLALVVCGVGYSALLAVWVREPYFEALLN
jgi:hypothetical protein